MYLCRTGSGEVGRMFTRWEDESVRKLDGQSINVRLVSRSIGMWVVRSFDRLISRRLSRSFDR
jgi:hypothetical protein